MSWGLWDNLFGEIGSLPKREMLGIEEFVSVVWTVEIERDLLVFVPIPIRREHPDHIARMRKDVKVLLNPAFETSVSRNTNDIQEWLDDHFLQSWTALVSNVP